MTGFSHRSSLGSACKVSENNSMTDLKDAARTVTDLLHLLAAKGNLNLVATVTTHDPASTDAAVTRLPELAVELSGPDAALLTERNGELLYAIEHLAAKVLRLEPEEHDRISFDADGFKASRDQALRESAAAAIAQMREQGRSTGVRPYVFPPMTSRERRLLHLIIAPSGLKTASTGEGPRRSVVLYPEGVTPPPEQPAGTRPGQRYALRQETAPAAMRRPRGFSRR